MVSDTISSSRRLGHIIWYINDGPRHKRVPEGLLETNKAHTRVQVELSGVHGLHQAKPDPTGHALVPVMPSKPHARHS